MKDLTIDIEDFKLNVRAAGVLIHNNKLLVHKNINSDHYAIVGGRVEIGESSEETIKREVQEELGKDIEIIECIGTIENFFESKDSKYHEILFVHKIEFENDEDKTIEYTLDNKEGKDYSHYEWLELDKLDNYNLVPSVIKQIVKKNKFPIHIINNELS